MGKILEKAIAINEMWNAAPDDLINQPARDAETELEGMLKVFIDRYDEGLVLPSEFIFLIVSQ